MARIADGAPDPADEREALRGQIRQLALRAIENDPLNARARLSEGDRIGFRVLLISESHGALPSKNAASIPTQARLLHGRFHPRRAQCALAAAALPMSGSRLTNIFTF
jgi:hypothetical protein